MQKITCPSCSTSYELPHNSIGAEGRKVKCATCGIKWLAKAESVQTIDPLLDSISTGITDDVKPEDIAAGTVETTKPTLATANTDVPIDADFEEDQPPMKGDPGGDVSLQLPALTQEMPRPKPVNPLMRNKQAQQRKPGFDKTERRERQQQKISAILRPTAFAATILILAGLVYAREPIVRLVPDLASLYAKVGLDVNLRGFAFREIRSERVVESSGPVLIVTGEIQNIKGTIAQAPKLRFGLKTNTNEEIYAWNHELSVPTIVPGGIARFQSRLPAPPPLGRNLSVRFTDG
ncbi:MAG: MJ0042-type zinc finger domain-containing protein [Hyphomicrobiales bacterium]